MAYDFYSLLPLIMRVRSEFATADMGEESVLQKICYMLEQEAEVTSDEIAGLATLDDIDECPIGYLPLIAKLLGIPYSATWSETKRRMFVKAAGLLWHIKGSRTSWEAFLNAHGQKNYFPWELWKSVVYEEFDYALYPDYEHRFKSARVDIRRSTDNTDPPNHGLFTEDEHVEPVRPIHVLIRRPGEYVSDRTEYLGSVNDTEGYGETGDFVAGAYWIGDVDPLDDGGFFGPTEYPSYEGEPGLDLSVSCSNTTCEVTCQTTCTSGCEASCQYGACEIGCQTFCQTNCQLTCEYACQLACEGTCENTACQAVSCEVGCQVDCEPGVETTAPLGCDLACEAYCEDFVQALGDGAGDPDDWFDG